MLDGLHIAFTSDNKLKPYPFADTISEEAKEGEEDDGGALPFYLPVVESQRRDFTGLAPRLLALQWDALSSALRDRLVATKAVVALVAGRRTLAIIVKSIFPAASHASLDMLEADSTPTEDLTAVLNLWEHLGEEGMYREHRSGVSLCECVEGFGPLLPTICGLLVPVRRLRRHAVSRRGEGGDEEEEDDECSGKGSRAGEGATGGAHGGCIASTSKGVSRGGLFEPIFDLDEARSCLAPAEVELLSSAGCRFVDTESFPSVALREVVDACKRPLADVVDVLDVEVLRERAMVRQDRRALGGEEKHTRSGGAVPTKETTDEERENEVTCVCVPSMLARIDRHCPLSATQLVRCRSFEIFSVITPSGDIVASPLHEQFMRPLEEAAEATGPEGEALAGVGGVDPDLVVAPTAEERSAILWTQRAREVAALLDSFGKGGGGDEDGGDGEGRNGGMAFPSQRPNRGVVALHLGDDIPYDLVPRCPAASRALQSHPLIAQGASQLAGFLGDGGDADDTDEEGGSRVCVLYLGERADGNVLRFMELLGVVRVPLVDYLEHVVIPHIDGEASVLHQGGAAAPDALLVEFLAAMVPLVSERQRHRRWEAEAAAGGGDGDGVDGGDGGDSSDDGDSDGGGGGKAKGPTADDSKGDIYNALRLRRFVSTTSSSGSGGVNGANCGDEDSRAIFAAPASLKDPAGIAGARGDAMRMLYGSQRRFPCDAVAQSAAACATLRLMGMSFEVDEGDLVDMFPREWFDDNGIRAPREVGGRGGAEGSSTGCGMAVFRRTAVQCRSCGRYVLPVRQRR